MKKLYNFKRIQSYPNNICYEMIRMIYGIFGKGGVGKTTISSALALEAVKVTKNVAIIATDPVPTLHYIFTKKIDGLDVYEYTEEQASEEWIRTYGDEVYDLITSFFDLDREIIEHIARAPGITDEFLLSKLLDIYKKYDIIIWDTAAASATLHLLKTEHEFYDHIGRDIKFYLSMKDILEKINRKRKNPLSILNRWRALAREVMNLLKQNGIYYIIETEDELSKFQGKTIHETLASMNLKIEAHITNRSRLMTNAFSIPEFKGDTVEIVNKIRPYAKKFLKLHKSYFESADHFVQ